MIKSNFSHSPIKALQRLIVVSLTVWLALGCYFVIDCCPLLERRDVVMPSWVPFWPVFTLPYLGMLLAAWFLPLAIQDPGRFRACLRGFIYAFLLVMPWWLLTPTTLHRPSFSETWGSGLYRWIAALDPPHNVMPCAHGIGPLVAAWFVVQERPGWKWPLIGMLVGGLASISLIWQHRPIDILLGAVASAVGIRIADWLRRQESPDLR